MLPACRRDALVHEVYLHISSLRLIDWEGCAYFIPVVTKRIRRILVDHARARNAAKRGASEINEVPPREH